MEISKSDLEAFKEIYKNEFGDDLSDDEALEVAQRLIGFFKLIYRPLPEDREPEEENPDIDF